jgi:hypothetical protein
VEEETPSPTQDDEEPQEAPGRDVTSDPRAPGGNPTTPDDPTRPGIEEVPEAD